MYYRRTERALNRFLARAQLAMGSGHASWKSRQTPDKAPSHWES